MKKAFTLIELIFVIVIIGILASIALPKLNKNDLSKAAIQVATHIRYAQHLAMMNDKFNSLDNDWYKGRWALIFGSSNDTNDKIAYSIFSDADNGSGFDTKPNLSELAIDPTNTSKYLSGGYSGILDTDDEKSNDSMNLGETYGITSYQLNGGCSGVRISFDHFGRPIKGTFNTYSSAYKTHSYYVGLIQSTCRITLSDSNENINILIEPETGYVHIE